MSVERVLRFRRRIRRRIDREWVEGEGDGDRIGKSRNLTVHRAGESGGPMSIMAGGEDGTYNFAFSRKLQSFAQQLLEVPETDFKQVAVWC